MDELRAEVRALLERVYVLMTDTRDLLLHLKVEREGDLELHKRICFDLEDVLTGISAGVDEASTGSVEKLEELVEWTIIGETRLAHARRLLSEASQSSRALH